jgi:hypothetical protein
MRKETTARLLLSLFTAFIMVAGALGAALPGLTHDEGNEGLVSPPVVDEADSELELQMSEKGEAPFSAYNGETIEPQENHPLGISNGPTRIDVSDFESGGFTMVESERPGAEDPEHQDEEIIEEQDVISLKGSGTRSPDSVDANGPYGTGIPFDPYWEGDPITFEASIEPEDEEENYKARWDVDGDGNWDGPGDASTDYFGEDGEMSMTKTFYDDVQGKAMVQAWDGSWKWITEDYAVLDEASWYQTWGIFGYSRTTWGWQFDVNEDITVDKLAAFVDIYGYPSTYYNLRLWDDTPSVIAYINNPSRPSTNNWRWYDLTTPVDLDGGRTYTITTYIYSTYGYMPTCNVNDVGPTPDGVVEPGGRYYGRGNVYPTNSFPYGYQMIDFHYERTYPVPNVLEDSAEILVWNRDPIVLNPVVSPTTTREGSADAQYTAQMVDLGLDDEWEYQWDFGDGTFSPWLPVPTWKGGMDIVIVHGCDNPGWNFRSNFIDPILDLLGPNAKRVEYYDYSWQGNDAAPELDYLLEFDVILHAGFAVGSGSGTHDDTGDVLADASDAGVGVVQMGNTFTPDSYGYNWGTKGRWLSEEYTCIPYGAPLIGTSGTSSFEMDVWGIHPITDGPFGTVTEHGAFLVHDSKGVTTWATLLSTYDSGHTQLAYTDVGHHGVPGSGRIVAFNTYPFGAGIYDYNEGDYIMIVANALFWASQQPLAEKLQQPYDLPPVSHIYKDDHPVHVTPSDQFQPRVRVRDDDHCNDRILGEPIVLDEDFNGRWGPMGDNPPPGWTIESHSTKAWDYNDWHRYYWYAFGGYSARVYYTPDEDQDEELISPNVDVSSYSTVTVTFDMYRYDYYNQADFDVDYRLDSGSWTNAKSYGGTYGYGWGETFDVSTGGASTLQIRFHMTDWGSSYKYWVIGLTEITAGSTTLLSEDFHGSWGPYGDNPPSGWTIIDNGVASTSWGNNDWHKYTFQSYYPSGTGTPAARIYYYPYGPHDDWLISPEIDLTSGAYSTTNFQFVTYFNHYYYPSECNVLYRLDGGTWQTLDQYTSDTDGLMTYNIDAAIGHKLQIAFHRYGTGQYNYFYWFVDNFLFEAIPVLKHVYGMSPWTDSPLITVANVAPEGWNELNVKLDVDENDPILFEGFRITDPALYEATEDFWYRWNFDDGTAIGPWLKPIAPPVEGKVLLLHWVELTGNSGPDLNDLIDSLNAAPAVKTLDVRNFGQAPYGDDYPTLEEMHEYDAIVFCDNWALTSGDIADRTQFGDNLADYVDEGGGVFTFMMGHEIGWAGDIWSIIGRYADDDYGAFEKATHPFSSGNLGTVYNPSHPMMNGVSRLFSPVLHGGSNTLTAGAELLADWTDGNEAIGAKDHGFARTAHCSLSIFAGYRRDDFDTFVANTIEWVMRKPKKDLVAPVPHTFADNGRYDVHLQVIDDDMWWDFASGYPVFVGPNMDANDPGADPNNWIGGTVFPVNVDNTDPVISPNIRAYAQLDMRLRISGTKDCTAYMTLYEDGKDIGSTFVSRDPGSPDIGIMPSVEIEVTKGKEYMVYVKVEDGSGGNPTWIFDMVFPDGKFKEFKHTFNDEKGWDWTITDSMLKGALLGHDIIFEAEAFDDGSDDLAFIYNWGDSTPHGIHLYANVDQGTAVDAVSDEATVIFDQLGVDFTSPLHRDPAFDKDSNSVRSPDGGPISVMDSISHVFDENQPYYYYVTVIVMDDDVEDDYPSTQLHPSPGCDLFFMEIDFR